MTDHALIIERNEPEAHLAAAGNSTHTDYVNALRALSRALLFFQHRNVLTHDNVAPGSISQDAPGVTRLVSDIHV